LIIYVEKDFNTQCSVLKLKDKNAGEYPPFFSWTGPPAIFIESLSVFLRGFLLGKCQYPRFNDET
jgi:hypothetical protein